MHIAARIPEQSCYCEGGDASAFSSKITMHAKIRFLHESWCDSDREVPKSFSITARHAAIVNQVLKVRDDRV